MRAKRARQPVLRKPPSKKVSEGVRTAGRRSRSKTGQQSAKPVQENPRDGRRRTTGDPRTAVFGLVCVIAAAALLSLRQPSYGREAAVPGPVASPDARVAAEPLENARNTTPASRASHPATPDPDPIEEPSIAAAPTPTRHTAAEPAAVAAGPSSVTITGCLERDDEVFRLREPSGANAPMARSWKSGFLKKRPASVEVVDTSDRLKLDKHVGHRVAIGGSLDDRELHARSIALAEGTCN